MHIFVIPKSYFFWKTCSKSWYLLHFCIACYLSYNVSNLRINSRTATVVILERQKLANSRRPSLQSSTASSVFEDSFISPKFPTSNSKTNSPNLTISDHLKPTSTDTTELTKTLVIGTEKSSAFSSVAPKLDEKDKNDLITDNKNDINEDSKDSNPDPKSDSNNSTTPKFKIHSDIFQCHNNKAPNEQQEKIDPEKESNPS